LEPRRLFCFVLKKISNSLNFVAGDSESEFLVKSSGRFYVISVQNIKINPELQSSLTAEYGEASPESQGDEDGQYDSYDYESTELDQSQIMNAAEDHIEQGKASTPEEYAAGEGFVYHLTPAMAEELWSSGSDLEHAPQVNRMIDYGKLRQAYPQAF